MPDIARILDMKFCHSSYESPFAEIDGWRLFMDGFIPSAANTALVGKILAWNGTLSPVRYYCSLVGVEDGAFEYQKGAYFPTGMARCVIDKAALRLEDNFVPFVESEINKAIDRLVALLVANHGITPSVFRIPRYDVKLCACCGQHLSEDVLRGMGL